MRAQTQGQALGPLPSGSSTLVRVISSTPNLERITESRQHRGDETQQVLNPTPSQAGMGGMGGIRARNTRCRCRSKQANGRG